MIVTSVNKEYEDLLKSFGFPFGVIGTITSIPPYEDPNIVLSYFIDGKEMRIMSAPLTDQRGNLRRILVLEEEPTIVTKKYIPNIFEVGFGSLRDIYKKVNEVNTFLEIIQ